MAASRDPDDQACAARDLLEVARVGSRVVPVELAHCLGRHEPVPVLREYDFPRTHKIEVRVTVRRPLKHYPASTSHFHEAVEGGLFQDRCFRPDTPGVGPAGRAL
ncbi:hypothetical protein QRX60_44290 [Amycolatopsis mongoliensis]|uniref:Uncharacterized protein n=1 Tax=Amycolatopsis mongoliensis TaxID=715475 RepID=A0A9Y2JQ83_9PSEU|nr:hypothetical protein [Amycolatopsis sp. 4-36]WIY00994.1 hypothetical protein QRX60_44290 [Amycolatopsis sp. 4-36]